MKTSHTLAFDCASFLLLVCAFALVTNTAEANPRRALKYADEALPLLPMLFDYFGKFAGLAGIIGSGIWARGKEKSQLMLSALVAAIGGIWSANAWFGWPMVKEKGLFFFGETQEFSFLGLIGFGVFAVLGIVAWAAIAFRGARKKKG